MCCTVKYKFSFPFVEKLEIFPLEELTELFDAFSVVSQRMRGYRQKWHGISRKCVTQRLVSEVDVTRVVIGLQFVQMIL